MKSFVATTPSVNAIEKIVSHITDEKYFEYAEWYFIGACIHNALPNEDGFHIFLNWSKTQPNFTSEEDVMQKWESYERSPVEKARFWQLFEKTDLSEAELDTILSESDTDKTTTSSSSSIWNIPTDTPTNAQAQLYFNAMFGDCSEDDFVCCFVGGKQRFIKKSELSPFTDEVVKLNGDSTLYCCVNPLKKKERKSNRVSAFKHLLVEFDELTIDEQKRILEKENFPAAAIVFSGKKSLHLIFKLDANSKKEFEERQEFVWDYLKNRGYKNDTATKDAVRFSRIAGCYRAETQATQQLISVNSGFATFEEWQSSVFQSEIKSKLENVKMISLSDALNYDENAAYVDGTVLIGNKYLNKGKALLINAYSGMGKSTLTTQLAIQMSAGKSLMGNIPVQRPLNVLLFQAENDEDEILQNVKWIFKNAVNNGDLEKSDFETIQKNFHVIPSALVGRGRKFLTALKTYIEMFSPDVVCIDPIFGFFDGNIKDQGEVSAFFRDGLQPILEKSNTAAILVHHKNKPTKDEQSLPFDAQNYAGSGSAELTNWCRAIINLERNKKDPTLFYMQLAKRGEKAGNGAKRTIFLKQSENPNQPYWYEVEAPVEEEMKNPRCKSKYDGKGYELLPELTESAFKDYVMEQEHCTEKQYRSYVRRSVCAGRVIYDNDKHTYRGVHSEKAKEVVEQAHQRESKGLLAVNTFENAEDTKIYQTLQRNNISTFSTVNSSIILDKINSQNNN